MTILILFVARDFISGFFFEILAKTILLYTTHFPPQQLKGKKTTTRNRIWFLSVQTQNPEAKKGLWPAQVFKSFWKMT